MQGSSAVTMNTGLAYIRAINAL